MSVGAIIGFIVLGAGAILAYVSTGKENRKIETWPKTKGTILTSRFAPGSSEFRQQGALSNEGRILVEYEFMVDGKRYQSDLIYTVQREYLVSNPDEMKTVEFLKNPEVRYNPLKPENCCLLPYPSNWTFTLVLWVGIIFSLIGWSGLLFKFL